MATSAQANSTDSAKFSDAEVRAIALLLQQRIDAGSEIIVKRSQLAVLVTANSELLKGKTASEGEALSLRASLKECQGETTAQVQVCAGKVAPGYRTGFFIALATVLLGTGVAIIAEN